MTLVSQINNFVKTKMTWKREKVFQVKKKVLSETIKYVKRCAI